MVKAPDYSMQYLYRARLAYLQVAPDIYKVIKERESVGEKFRYVTTSTVVDSLNNQEDILILDKNFHYIHANFEV